ncbi:MAG TPA: AAA family ATPase [Pseudonocardiaceae bacterium]|jgi:LuxR family maltose regulon positive regulatory protein|nr:AAA family ATPase [Pseudonocardiaceae bacterium]
MTALSAGQESVLIDRHDLLAALDRAASRTVTIISAPAGGGKTSLVRAWVDRPGRALRVAAVSVRRDQRDAQQFWLSLLGAVRTAGGATEPIAATPGFNGPAMVDRVLSEFDADRRPLMLVIDDLHQLNSPEAFEHLTSLLLRLPPHVHAMLAVRHDLRLGLHRLRLAGELAEIRAPELRFTEQEARDLMAAEGIGLSDGAIAVLHRRTEGWAAGLRLAAISMAGHPDPARFVAEFSGSDRTVAEYLLAEMLERQPDRVRNMLLRTSLLDRVNGELADALSGRSGSEQILLELEDANAFVVSVDPERTWFRYHHFSVGCCGWNYAGRCPRRPPRCTGWPRDGSPTTGTPPTPSGTYRPRATGTRPPNCSPITCSA